MNYWNFCVNKVVYILSKKLEILFYGAGPNLLKLTMYIPTRSSARRTDSQAIFHQICYHKKLVHKPLFTNPNMKRKNNSQVSFMATSMFHFTNASNQRHKKHKNNNNKINISAQIWDINTIIRGYGIIVLVVVTIYRWSIRYIFQIPIQYL